jgi:hypothetical protein
MARRRIDSTHPKAHRNAAVIHSRDAARAEREGVYAASGLG